MSAEQIHPSSSISKVGAYVAAGMVILALVAGAFFLTKHPARETTVRSVSKTGKTKTETRTSTIPSLKCEDIVPRVFLEKTLGASLTEYGGTVSKNIQEEDYLTCIFRVGEGEASRGGLIIIGESDAAEYEACIHGFRAQGMDVKETNDIGLKSAEIAMGGLDFRLAGVKQRRTMIYLVSSDNRYIVSVVLGTFGGEDPIPFARIIARKVDSLLSRNASGGNNSSGT